MKTRPVAGSGLARISARQECPAGGSARGRAGLGHSASQKRGLFGRASRLLGALLLAGGAVSCGWHAGLQAPDGVGSVGIDVFPAARPILERDLEPVLNRAMTRAFVDLVDAPLEHPRRADVVVRGEITQYVRRAGVRNEDNELVETGVLVEASARLVDRRTGAVLVPTRNARVWSSYGLDGVTAVQQEDVARERAFRHIAETLILDLFRPEEENPEAAEQPLPPDPQG